MLFLTFPSPSKIPCPQGVAFSNYGFSVKMSVAEAEPFGGVDSGVEGEE